jgi:NTP pyrophosphatase (non-canonical NTP hydrolase)
MNRPLKEISEQCMEDSIKWFPATAYDLPFQTLCMVGEMGEFANEVKKAVRAYNGAFVGNNELREKLCEELTDGFIYMMNIAEILSMDMQWWYDHKREINRLRFDQNARQGGIKVKDNPQA